MIGVAMIDPYWPGLVIVKVPPYTSSGVSCRDRARRAISRIRAASPSTDSSCARGTTGTISPSSPSDTAIPRFTSLWRVYFSPSSHAFIAGCSRMASIDARATNASAVTPRRARTASTRPMSTSIHVVHVAAVSRGPLHVLADLPAHPGKAVAVLRHRGRRRRHRLGPVRALDVERRLLDRGRFDERQHVLLAHATTPPGARHLTEVDPVLGGDPLDHGRVAPIAVGGGRPWGWGGG